MPRASVAAVETVLELEEPQRRPGAETRQQGPEFALPWVKLAVVGV